MSVIGDEELADLRAAAVELLPEQAVLLDRVPVRDTTGGTKATWVPRPGTVPARVGRVRDAEQVPFAGQLRGKATAALTLPALTVLTEADRVQVLGQTYNVVAVLGPVSWEVTRRLLVEQV